jgi:hypothetical protein
MDGRITLKQTLQKKDKGCGMIQLAQVKYMWSALTKMEMKLLIP